MIAGIRRLANRLSGRKRQWDDLNLQVWEMAHQRGLEKGHNAWLFMDIIESHVRELLLESTLAKARPLLPLNVAQLNAKQVEACFVAKGYLMFRFCEQFFPDRSATIDALGAAAFGQMWSIEKGNRAKEAFPRIYLATLVAVCDRCGNTVFDEGNLPFDFSALLQFRTWCEGMFPFQSKALCDLPPMESSLPTGAKIIPRGISPTQHGKYAIFQDVNREDITVFLGAATVERVQEYVFRTYPGAKFLAFMTIGEPKSK